MHFANPKTGESFIADVSKAQLATLDSALAVAEGNMRAAIRGEEWCEENGVIHGDEPAWLANHEIAFYFFCVVNDFASALIVLERVCLPLGEFVDETKDMAVEERKPIIGRFIAMCKRIGDFSIAWGEIGHPHDTLIQMHRRCSKLFNLMKAEESHDAKACS